MDEERWRLTPEGFDAVEDGFDLDDEEIFFARILQSYEAMELGGASEEDLVEIVSWYHRAMADQELISMTKKGLLYCFLDDNGEVAFKATPMGAEMTRAYAKTHGFDLPEEDELPSLD